MKKGFSLIELSIVLVIIGLLIGGILVAQSMTNTVKIQSFVKEMQQFDIMASNFKNQYKGVPGDSSDFSSLGNDNGLIDDGCNEDSWEDCFEIANFWVALQKAELTPKNLNFTATPFSGQNGLVSVGATINVPHLSYAKNAQVLAMADGEPRTTNPSNFLADTSASRNHWLITDKTADRNIIDDPFMPPADAYAVDLKMDDGKPFTGYVRSSMPLLIFEILPTGGDCLNKPKPSYCTPPISGCGVNANDVNSAYNINARTKPCSLSIVMFNQTSR